MYDDWQMRLQPERTICRSVYLHVSAVIVWSSCIHFSHRGRASQFSHILTKLLQLGKPQLLKGVWYRIRPTAIIWDDIYVFYVSMHNKIMSTWGYLWYTLLVMYPNPHTCHMWDCNAHVLWFPWYVYSRMVRWLTCCYSNMVYKHGIIQGMITLIIL